MPREDEHMIADSEYRMLVNELREDPTFVNALESLRTALKLALHASHPNKRRDRYAEVARNLASVYSQLEKKR